MTNKTTTTNQKHAGTTGKRRDMRYDRGGVGRVQVDHFRATKLGYCSGVAKKITEIALP
jgi:hypothetical protein